VLLIFFVIVETIHEEKKVIRDQIKALPIFFLENLDLSFWVSGFPDLKNLNLI